MQLKDIICHDRNFQFVFHDKVVHPSPIRINNLKFDYCQDQYNNAISNERTVEIPLAEYFIEKMGEENVLEVGAVTPYYSKKYNKHQIIDIDDKECPNVIREDALKFDYTGKNVLCVSTVEHFDQQDPVNSLENSKSIQFLEKILTESKNYFITFPIGFNKRLDEYVKTNSNIKNLIMKRVTSLNDWMLHENNKDFSFTFFNKYFCASAICVISNLEEFLVKEKLRIPFGSGGCGDLATYQALARHYHGGIIIEMLNRPEVVRLASIMDGLCDIEVKDNPVERLPHHPIFNTHAANCLLEVCGIFGKSYYPKSVIKEEEKQWAKDKLKTIQKNDNKPFIAFVADGGGTGSEDNQNAQLRYFTGWQDIINEVCKKFTILQFGLSKNHTKFDNVIPVLDLNFRELLGMYAVIKRYFGIDTGDQNLMLSAGGFCHVLTPHDGRGYHGCHWRYEEDSFKGELCRTKYYYFEDYQSLVNDLLK